MGKIYSSLTEIIGKTPLLRFERFEKKNKLNAKIIGKLEYLNPSGSMKDRAAYAIIKDAEEKGILKENSIIIEPTSGNTGIALSSIAASRGYKVILTMPESMSIERRSLLGAYGAELILTAASEGMRGAINKAEELNKEIENSFIAGQFTNSANPRVHKETTGPEIWEDMDGKIDILVAPVGTGGSITGTGEFLKSKNPNIKIVAVEPKGSPVLSGGHPGVHKIQGIGAGFIPKILNTEIYDEIIKVADADAIKTSISFAKNEGLLIGISSGAALYAAKEVAKNLNNHNKTIVALLPDGGERYLSIYSNF